MQEDDQHAGMNAAVERLNAGDPIPPIDPSLLEHVWEIMSRVPREQRENRAIGLGAFAMCDPNREPASPEQQVALMARLILLDALDERGVLNEYMGDESSRKKVFAAAASLPCDKNDLGEALAQKHLRESPPDEAAKFREELRNEGLDPDHPKVGKRLMEWMKEH